MAYNKPAVETLGRAICSVRGQCDKGPPLVPDACLPTVLFSTGGAYELDE